MHGFCIMQASKLEAGYLHGNKAAVSRIPCFVPLAVVWNVCNEYAIRCGLQCDRVLATNMNCILVVCGMHM